MSFFTDAFPLESIHKMIYTQSNLVALIGPAGKSLYTYALVTNFMKENPGTHVDVFTAHGYSFDESKMSKLLSDYNRWVIPKDLFLIVNDAHLLKQEKINVFRQYLPNPKIHVILESQNMTDALRILRSSIEYTSAWLFQYHDTALEMMRSEYGENHHSNQDFVPNYDQHFFSVDGSSRCITALRATIKAKENTESRSVQCELDLDCIPPTTGKNISPAYRAQLRRKREIRGPSFLRLDMPTTFHPCIGLEKEEDEFLEANEEMRYDDAEDDDSEKTRVHQHQDDQDEQEWSATDKVNHECCF